MTKLQRKLSITGETRSENIVLGNNKITTAANPTGDKDLSRKKYVDDKLKKKFDKTGGNIAGNVHFKQDIYMDSTKYIHNSMTSVPGSNILISKRFADLSNIQQGGNLNRDLSTGQYQIVNTTHETNT